VLVDRTGGERERADQRSELLREGVGDVVAPDADPQRPEHVDLDGARRCAGGSCRVACLGH
jgi:hypothetical protein